MSSQNTRLIEQNRLQPDMEVHELLSTTPNVPPHMAQDQTWKDKAASVLQTVYDNHQPATLVDAYRAWRDDPQTCEFAAAVRAQYLRDYRDDGADPASSTLDQDLT
ncbi:hypothetical protein [Burkholderia ubonensis]|uniref:hypothetical protein n=1 Tax=Burkholderia ubonensis TaxID=101571 RepID=UPI000A66FFA9|nr:hypothetical protein [Burkholderia ubonensis]